MPDKAVSIECMFLGVGVGMHPIWRFVSKFVFKVAWYLA